MSSRKTTSVCSQNEVSSSFFAAFKFCFLSGLELIGSHVMFFGDLGQLGVDKCNSQGPNFGPCVVHLSTLSLKE